MGTQNMGGQTGQTRMTHSELLAAIQLAYSHGDTRLLKVNAGESWAGRIIQRSARTITLQDYRHIQMGAAGISDLIGWVGPHFVAIEAKTGSGRPTREQKDFIDLVQRCGGRAGVARSVEDAGRILTL